MLWSGLYPSRKHLTWLLCSEIIHDRLQLPGAFGRSLWTALALKSPVGEWSCTCKSVNYEIFFWTTDGPYKPPYYHNCRHRNHYPIGLFSLKRSNFKLFLSLWRGIGSWSYFLFTFHTLKVIHKPANQLFSDHFALLWPLQNVQN